MQGDFENELHEILISNCSKEELNDKLENYHASDIADALEKLTKDERLRIYSMISIEHIAEVFVFYENVEDYIDELEPELAADILEKMDSNEAADVLNELEDEDKEEIIELMEDEQAEKVIQIDAYDEDEIGSYMSDNYIVLNINDTISKATSKTIKQAGEHDNIFTLYVVNENDEYCGAVNIKDLFVARKTDKLADFVMESYPYFIDKELMSECINRLKDYSEDSVPVLNEEKHIVGVITSDIVIEATEEELNEDYAKLAGLSEEEDMDESVFESIKKRIPWLIILLFLGLLVSTVTGSFEGVIATIPVVVFFQTMILGMSGNVGTQSLAVTIRNLSNGESRKKLVKGVFKELGIGFINGLIISIVAFLFVIAFLAIRKQEVTTGEGYVFVDTMKIAGIIGSSLLIAMTVSDLIGTLFPILLTKLHIDPAVASGPFITTINDIVSIFIYYGLTWLLFLAFA